MPKDVGRVIAISRCSIDVIEDEEKSIPWVIAAWSSPRDVGMVRKNNRFRVAMFNPSEVGIQYADIDKHSWKIGRSKKMCLEYQFLL